MLVASGTLLVLMTWLAATGIVATLGLLPSLLTNPQGGRWRVTRRALWWGLLVLAIAAYAINLSAPLHSLQAGLLLGALGLLMGVPGWWLLRRRRPGAAMRPPLVPVGVLAMVGITLAIAALGPVTNYDSGLYHLQAIRYAADFPTLAGLANVFFPLGYANAEFPLAAVMGLGPWGFDGFRLINGLVIVLALVDLALRAGTPRRGAGFWVLLVGMTVVVITMLPLSDYWVTSPTQDSTAFVITIVASAYLADAITQRRWIGSAAVLVALSTLLVMLRPTMAVFALGALIVLGAVAWRRRPSRDEGLGRATLATVVVVILAGVASTARDYVLSGWLQYPLSIHAFDVPWRAADPTDPRTATLGAARDPSDLWTAAQGWGWIPAWFGRLPFQWETYAFLLLAGVAVALVLLTARQGSLRLRALALGVTPSVLAIAFWWLLTPPSFRFSWGPLFSLTTIPIGWALWRLQVQGRSLLTSSAPALAASVMIVVSIITLSIRIDYASMTQRQEWRAGVSIPYVVAPPEPGDVTVAVNPAGLEHLVPVSGEQCWLAFPTCSPQMAGTVRLRGEGIGSGYLP